MPGVGIAPWRALQLLLLGLSLSACGFHLRGSVKLPPVMARTYIDAGQADELATELGGLLQGSGVELVVSRGQATAVIRLMDEQRRSRVTTVNTSGAASSYELSDQVDIELQGPDGEVLLPRQTLSRSRDLNFDGSNVLGKSREQQQIYSALRRDLAAAILTHIQYGLPRAAP